MVKIYTDKTLKLGTQALVNLASWHEMYDFEVLLTCEMKHFLLLMTVPFYIVMAILKTKSIK